MTTVGRSLRRVEDERFITGHGSYVGDISRPGQVWARVVRSPIAHGRLRAVGLDAARAREDVVAAISASDIPGNTELRIPCRLSAPPNSELATQPPLAIDRVRYVGEPVAVVVAADPYAAEDAAEQVVLEIEELDPVLDPLAAIEPGAPVLHPGLEGNVVGSLSFRHGRSVEELFGEADVVVAERLFMHRHSSVPMETRGLIAEVDASGRVAVWGPTKVKHHNRALLASMLGIAEERVRMIEPDVGGGFGARGEFYPEDFLVPWLALRLGRPVKWIEDRAENLVAMNHSRERVYEIEVAARADGTLLGFRSSDWCAMGGYLRTAGLKVPEISGRHIAGPYRWQGFDATTHGVMTNKTPLGTFRGPGEAEATFARERMLDLLAAELGIDPAELRLRNLIPVADPPYRLDFGDQLQPVVHEASDYPRQFRALLEHVDYERLRARLEDRRQAGELVGVGMACFLNEGGYGPFEWARIVAEPDGTFTGYVGAASVGQGVQTALGQILADAIDVPFERVRIHHHDTDVVKEGVGSWADRTTAMGGSAILLAAEELKREARRAGAAALGVGADDVEIEADSVRSEGRRTTFAELGSEGTARFERPGMHFSLGASVAVVSIAPETGRVTVERYVGAYDVGRAINPMIVHGQLDGAAAQGIAGSLFEEFAYDEYGQPPSISFVDYLIPTCAEMPEVESLVFEFPAADNPLGAKGAGNPGIVGTYAALANATSEALGMSVTRLPLRPNAVRALLRERPPVANA